MITKKSMVELIEKCKEVASWIHKNTPKDTSREILNPFWAAIHSAENDLDKKREGFLLLIENPKKGRRITVTVEEPDRYLSRTGWESAGIEAQVTHSKKVKDIDAARDELKKLLPGEKFMAMGMDWTQKRPRKL